jgi:hypothetical protein
MIELILNLAWAATAILAFVLVPRRDRHALAALACVIALLFPIISVSDDLHADATLFETLAAILAAVCVFFALVAMARVHLESRITPAFALIVHADPRSPPRR